MVCWGCVHDSCFIGSENMKYLDVKGKALVDGNNKVLGRVDDFIVDVRNMRVNCFMVSNTLILSNYYVVPYSKAKIFKDFIELSVELCKIKRRILLRNKYIRLENHLDKEIIDVKGRKIGKLIDVIFDEEDGKFRAIVVSSGFFEDVFEGRKIILVNNNTIFKEKNIIVDECNFLCRNDVSFKKYLRE